ncbi:MAG: ribosome assembly cofactor RimP [Rikenellaceae bacterium]|nr:ribosome assembly cofactor RimP [Rikenellaceae bacterium]MCL2691991.1 ribosome assembly cofactor RimP [Rikenellaceae bacterium]
MLDIDKIREIAERELAGSELFLVDIKSSPAGVVEVLIDSDRSVAIDDCVVLSRAIDAEFDRDQEDYELTVGSAGVGQPLKVLRQYKKLVGKPVEVMLRSGTKIVAELRSATPDAITLAYTEMAVVEGKKRKEKIEVVREYPLDEVKWTKEHLDFK